MLDDREKQAIDDVDAFHGEVNRHTQPLQTRHAQRLQCRLGCSQCCMDELSVFEVEAAGIREHHAALLQHASPHAKGACAFLDDRGACRIYEHRPYVCRTQGLPLRWLEDDAEEDALVEYRDICPLNEDESEPIEALPTVDCWEIGPFEQRLASLQHSVYGELKRVRLRDLFKRR